MVPGPRRSQIACSAAGIVGGGEPVGQFGELQPGPGRLTFGPFVSVDPHLDWPRTVGADLDERRTEIGVPEVEVVDRDPAVLLVEGELRRLGRVGVALAGDEHPLRLLRHPDRGDLRTPLTRSRIQISTHHFDVAVGGFQPHHRNVVGIGVGGDRAAKRIADLLQARRGGTGTRGAAGTAPPAHPPAAGRGSHAGRPGPGSPDRVSRARRAHR